MRRCRINLPNRRCRLISRVAHRASFLDGDERTRLVDFVRRVAVFSGVKLLAYCVMSNHIHVFVYIGRPEPLSDAEIVRRISALYSDVRFEQVMKKWNELAKRPDSPSFRRYRASFLRRMWNASEWQPGPCWLREGAVVTIPSGKESNQQILAEQGSLK